jgi:putative hydrolase of the HAD superfamily
MLSSIGASVADTGVEMPDTHEEPMAGPLPHDALVSRSGAVPGSPATTLLFDGDDTLWANNHHFERAIDAFTALVRSDGWTDDAIRGELDRIEERGFASGVVGTAAFGRNLREAAASIVAPTRLDEVRRAIDELVVGMATTSVDLLPDVEMTLDTLGRSFVLGLVTRGDPAEQWAKIDASGLRGRFTHIAVVAHKTAATYSALVADWRLDPASTWMIGNSPRSDILPARTAGLRAVHVRHGSTWRLEHAHLDPGDAGVAVLDRFAGLVDLLLPPATAPVGDLRQG